MRCLFLSPTFFSPVSHLIIGWLGVSFAPSSFTYHFVNIILCFGRYVRVGRLLCVCENICHLHNYCHFDVRASHLYKTMCNVWIAQWMRSLGCTTLDEYSNTSLIDWRSFQHEDAIYAHKTSCLTMDQQHCVCECVFVQFFFAPMYNNENWSSLIFLFLFTLIFCKTQCATQNPYQYQCLRQHFNRFELFVTVIYDLYTKVASGMNHLNTFVSCFFVLFRFHLSSCSTRLN